MCHLSDSPLINYSTRNHLSFNMFKQKDFLTEGACLQKHSSLVLRTVLDVASHIPSSQIECFVAHVFSVVADPCRAKKGRLFIL